MIGRQTLVLMGAAMLAGCASIAPPQADPQARFFASLSALCGKAFAGQIVSEDPADADWRGKPMTIHVRECSDDAVRIPLHVGDDRSRTWVVSKAGDTLRLKHDHRHEDGVPDAVTMYGGDATNSGTAQRQEFPVDAESIALFEREDLAASVTNVWAMEVSEDELAYELRRPSGRYFRAEFDLSKPVSPPPPPWGAN